MSLGTNNQVFNEPKTLTDRMRVTHQVYDATAKSAGNKCMHDGFMYKGGGVGQSELGRLFMEDEITNWRDLAKLRWRLKPPQMGSSEEKGVNILWKEYSPSTTQIRMCSITYITNEIITIHLKPN